MRNIRIKYSVDDAELRKSLKTLDMTDDEIDDIQKNLKQTQKEANKAGKSLDKAGKDGQKSLGGLGKAAKKIGGALIAAFAVDRVIAFGKKVIEITAEFQKLNAVLSTALGSEGLAQRAFKDIQQFAATTNFSVLELTNGFVKLVNQGFQPTIDELGNLGDLANSTGKSFDQLAEAIIDAQVGEFERLKEFGIRAKQQGDQVTFTFKGVETQVKKTDKEIQKYILSLGDLESVSGSTEKISKTLGGQISNLGDSLDTLFFTIGEGSNGVLALFIRSLNEAIQSVTDLAKRVLGVQDAFVTSDATLNRLVDDFKELGSEQRVKEINNVEDAVNNLTEKVNDQRKVIEAAQEAGYDTLGPLAALAENFNKPIKDAKEELKGLEQKLLDLQALQTLYTKSNQELALSENISAEASKEAREAANKYWQDQLDNLQKYANSLNKLRATGGLFPESEAPPELSGELQDFNNDVISSLKDRLDKEQDLKDKDLEKNLERLEIEKEARQEFEEVLTDLALETYDTLFGFDEQRFEMLRYNRSRELELAGENNEAKLAIEKNFDEQEKRLMAEKARREQQQALFELLVNQGPAIAKTASALGFPLAIPFIAAIGALFIQQISKTRSQQVPKFHTGKHPGDLQSNEVHAIVRKDEAILSPEATKMYNRHGLVDMMVDRKLDPQLLDTLHKSNTSQAITVKSDSQLLDAVKNITTEEWRIKDKEMVKYIRNGRNRTMYYNTRYRL